MNRRFQFALTFVGAALLLFMASLAQAQEPATATTAADTVHVAPPTGEPEAGRASFLAAPTGTPSERIHRLMAEYGRDAPGAAIAVVKQGELVFASGHGSANLEYGVPITPASVFYLASLSKQFTGFALAMLIAEGELSLDDPVHRYVPQLPNYGTPLLIRHLVYHTSGLRNLFALAHLQGGSGSDLITYEDAFSLIVSQRETNFDPGRDFLYSNAGYVLLAKIVERVSGRSFPQFMQDEVFEPLGMTSSLFLDHHERIIPDRVDSYKSTSDGPLLKVIAPMTVHGSTGAYSSAEDLARWLANLQAPTVGGEQVVEIMYQTGTLENGDPLNYGFGLDFGEYRGLSVVGHGGEFVGFRTFAGRIPERDLGVVVLSNGPDSPDPFQTFLEVVDIYLGDEGASGVPEPADPQAIARWAGEYAAKSGLPVRLVASGATLEASLAGGPLYPLTPISDSEFSGIAPWGAGFRITFDPDSDVAMLSLYGTSRLQRIEPSAEPLGRWSPEPEDLCEYAGPYHNLELGATYTIAVEGDVIVAKGPSVDVVLRPEVRDRFEGDRWFFGGALFERDEVGTIIALRVSGFRLRGVLFERQESSFLPGSHSIPPDTTRRCN